MSNENEIVQKLFNNFVRTLDIDYINSSEHFNIKEMSTKDIENTLSQYKYYSKKYLRYFDEKSG